MTALTLKKQKEMESELHHELYNNILVLTLEHPTTNDFKKYFQKDMFVKNNVAGFQHVTHFLLTVHDAASFNQKVCWPILDRKMEARFRNEVMKYINEELILKHEESGIPQLMTSHLVSPGGYRFVEFMHKLSQFVLLKYLQSDESDSVLLPLKYDPTIGDQQLKLFQKVVDNQYLALAQQQVAFHSHYEKALKIAADLTEEKNNVDREYLEVKHQETELRKIKEKVTQLSAGEDYEQLNKKIEKQLEALKNTDDEFKLCAELVEGLSLNRNVLKYDQSSSLSTGSVTLETVLESVHEVIKRKKQVLQYGVNYNYGEELEQLTEMMPNLNERYNDSEKLNSEMIDFISHLEDTLANYKYSHNSSNNNELIENIKKVYEAVSDVNINISNLY